VKEVPTLVFLLNAGQFMTMVRLEELVVVAVVSLLVGAGSGYVVVSTSMEGVQASISQLQSAESGLVASASSSQNQANDLNSRLSNANSQVASISNSLSTLSAGIDVQSQRLNALQGLSITGQLATAQETKESLQAYRDLKQYMITSGSGLATAMSSEVVNQMDQNGLIPSVFGQGKDQVKAALIPVVASFLKSYVPSSSWVENSATNVSPEVYSTSLVSSIPISVSLPVVGGITLFRIIVIVTATVDISTGVVSNLLVSSVSIGT
jgi:hypothetical protein